MQSESLSIALVPAAVTAVLKSILENGLIDHGLTGHLGSDILVSAQPFDRVETGENEHARINIFLYQINPKGITGYRRPGSERSVDSGIRYISEVELFYVVTAYGAQDLHSEMLLGCAIQSLHDSATVGPELIQSILTAQSSPRGGRVVPAAQSAVAASGSSAKIKCLRIVPYLIEPERLVSLWSSQQAPYRPSTTYQVTVVLTEPPSAHEAGDKPAKTVREKNA